MGATLLLCDISLCNILNNGRDFKNFLQVLNISNHIGENPTLVQKEGAYIK